jgi:small-conductance mechanosensitive channel
MQMASKTTTVAIFGLIAFVCSAVLSCILWGACRTTVSNYYVANKGQVLGILFSIAPKFFLIILLFIVFKIFYKIIIDLIFFNIIKHFTDEQRPPGFTRLIRVTWWVLFSIITLSIVIGDIGALVTSLGLIGFGITFALQKPLSNFVGWLTITMKGLYKEGDRVQIGKIIGDVREIQVMNTVLESLLKNSDTKDRRVVTFPNEFVLTSEVINFTKDENYIKDELVISVTYESDYHRAIDLLNKIVTENIKKNKDNYIRYVRNKQLKISNLLEKIREKAKFHHKNELTQAKAKRLEEEKKELDEEIKYLEDLEEELKPHIRLEMADSSLQLIAQFFTPYDEIKKNRTEINIAFLDAIKFEKNIEVAYPHLELVYDKGKILTD